MTDELQAVIDHDRQELARDFCRGCGYCLPCPAGIDIPSCARMSLMIRRAPVSIYLNHDWIKKMEKIEDCIHCNHCMKHCPYGIGYTQTFGKELG